MTRTRGKTREEHRTNAMGLWTSANNFFEAASLVSEQSASRISIPAYFLFCRSIELALKAFLRSRGHDLNSVINFRHNLDALLTAASEAGLGSVVLLEKKHENAIRLINQYYVDKELEYIVTGSKQFPQIDLLHSCAESILEATKGSVTANPKRKEG